VIADAGNYDGALVATNNWWNSASGPGGDGPGTGSSIYGDGYYVSGHQWVELTDGDAVFSPWSTVPINITATPSPAAPSQLTAAAVSTSQINLSWTDNAAGIENGFILQRSTDGLNYTQIATLAQGITTYADSSLSAGTTYYYRVEATSTYGDSAFSAAASAATISTSAIITNLSSLNWVSATTGYGSVQKNLSVNGNAITLKGVVYPSGISANAVANIVYNLGGAYTNFLATIGIDDEELTRGTGSVDFQVKGDGTLLYDSGILTNSSPAVSINVSVAGVQTLTLIANNGVPNTIDYDQGDWAGARLISSATQALVPPSNLIATDVSATQVNLSWTSTAANATGFVIQRSTDGVNFTTIATLASTSPTTYSDTTVAGSTTYYYQVLAADANAGLTSGASNIASVTTISASTITTNLSSLNWVSATTQYGSVQKNLSVNGNAITLKGVVYPSGISANAVANIVYNLAGAYTNFLATIGIDDEELNRGVGSVDFQVEGDGKLLYDSGVLTNSSPAVSINVSVAGVQTLTLVANNGVPNTIDYDQGDWAGARLLSTPQVPSAPTGLTAVTSSASQINLLWTAPTGTAAMGYLVQRSTDGVNFTTIASLGNVTNYFDKTAAAGTTYTYRILASNVVGNSLPSVTASATTLSSSAIVTNLSSLAWVSATIGYGSVQTNSTVAGNTLTLRGVTYSTGIGTHAVSNIVYNLNGAYTNFISDVGVDDEENGKGIGSVDFQVMGDGNLLFDSGVLTNNSPIVSLDVNVTGVKQLTLIATNGVANSIDYDHSDWAGARLISLPTVSPAVIIAAPAVEIATSKTESNSSNTLVSNASAVRAASRPALDVASQTPKAESVAIEPIRTAVHKKDQRLGLGVLKAVRQTVVIAGLEEFAPR
jgi:fibronectin type 3 domain-containing protein